MSPDTIPLHGRDGSVRAYALVDPEDHAALSERRWSFDASTGYAVSGVPGAYRNIRMHRELAGLDVGDPREVDHRNRNRLDNRRENLRVVTRAEQMQNLPPRQGVTSKYRGVSYYRPTGRWRAHCQLNGKQHHLGYFGSEENAAAAASAFRREHMPYSTEET